MLKISIVMLTTAMFAGLVIAGPAGQATTVSAADTAVAFVKVKTISIHADAGATKVASFVPVSDNRERKPNIRRNSGRIMAGNGVHVRSRA